MVRSKQKRNCKINNTKVKYMILVTPTAINILNTKLGKGYF
jgi:hypothetical protein